MVHVGGVINQMMAQVFVITAEVMHTSLGHPPVEGFN
jgi:hypothetical protein